MKQYWTSLDGLRAIAVGIVMLAHAGSPYPKSGGVGVDIFFVLSGFLITGILAEEYRKFGTISRLNFYLRRLLRLTPCLVAAVGLFALLSWWSEGTVRLDIVAIALTYTGNYARALFDYDLASFAHCWSLAIEEQYYLVWPLVILALEQRAWSHLTKFKVLLGLTLALGAYRAGMSGIYSAKRIYFALDTHMDGLVLGSALAYLRAALPGFGSGLAMQRGLQLLSRLVVPAAIIGMLYLMWRIGWTNRKMALFGFTFAAVASGALVLDLAVSPYSWLRRILEQRILVYCGRISYGLYLYHYPIYHFVAKTMDGWPGLVRVPVMVLASFAVAIASFHLMERRFLGWRAHFVRAEPEAAAARVA